MERTELNDRIASLNVELLEHLIQALQWLLQYSTTEKVMLPNLKVLGHLLIRSEAIIREMAEQKYNPLTKNPVLSDANLQGKPSDKDLTKPFCRI